MPKIKVRQSAAKRFKVTKNGKVLFGHQNQQHHKLARSKSRTRRQKEPGVMVGAFAKKIKKMLAV